MIENYKHTYSDLASILILGTPNIESMIEDHDLSTKSGRIAYVIEVSGHKPGSIAKLLKCAPAAVYQWINGSTKNLKEDLLWALADITGYEARWISTGQEPMKIEKGIKHATLVLSAMEPEGRYKAIRLLDTLAEPAKKESMN